MFEELNNRRKAVEQNIIKSFVNDNDIEKAREKKQFSIGDTFTRHGITYRCTGISPNTGRPTWSKVGSGSKQSKEDYVFVEADTFAEKFKDAGIKVNVDHRGGHYDIVELNDEVRIMVANSNSPRQQNKQNSKYTGVGYIVIDDSVAEGKKKQFYDSLLNGLIAYQRFNPKDDEDFDAEETKTLDIVSGDVDFIVKTYKDVFNNETKSGSKQTGKLSDLQVGDEVEIVEDNKGKITKKKGKITKVNAASFEVGGERFYKRTGYHVGMDNVKITIS
jgi:hypothetical protein